MIPIPPDALGQRRDVVAVEVRRSGALSIETRATLLEQLRKVEGVPARPTRVEFRLEGHPTLDAGSIDLAESRQIKASWPSGEDR